MTAKDKPRTKTKSRPTVDKGGRRGASPAGDSPRAVTTKGAAADPPADVKRLLQELQIQQIEVEAQNEELRAARGELEASRARYFELYDLAPVGYVTLSEDELMLDVNLTAAALLGIERGVLFKLPLARFILPADQDVFRVFCTQLAETGARQACELHMLRAGVGPFWARLEATAARDEERGERVSRVTVSDISDRKRAENLLLEREKHFRLLVQNSNDIIGILDENAVPTYISESIFGILGYRPEELLGQSMFARVHPDDLAAISTIFADGLAEPGAVRKAEHRFRHKNGTWVDLETIGCNRLRDPLVKGIVLNSRDNTERKRADAEIRAQKALLEAQLDSTIDGILIVDCNRKKIVQNRRCVDLWGVPEQIAADPDAARQLEFVKNLAKDPEAFLERALYLYAHPDETVRDEVEFRDGMILDRYTAPVIGKDGAYFGRIWVFRDVTEQKKTEKALRDSEARFRSLFLRAPIGVALTDAEGRFEEVNEALCGMLGYTRAELQGRSIAEITAPDDAGSSATLFDRVIRGKVPAYVGERRYLTKGGAVIRAEVTTSAVRGPDGRFMYGMRIVQDVTDLRRAEEEKQRLNDQLQQALKMEAVGRLAGGVAHDFNNLLQVINGYAEYAIDNLAPEDRLREDMQNILDSGRRASNLTRQLLAFGRRQVLRPVVLDVNKATLEMAEILRRFLGEDIELVLALAPDLGRVKADPGQFELVLMNLAVNSRDAMPQGGTLTIETVNVELNEPSAARPLGIAPGPYVTLAVSDTGRGMDEATKASVFEPFFTTKEQGKGSGLGLATVYGIVRQSGGAIWLESELGRGTTFKICLPRLAAAAEAAPPETPETTRARGTETILLVEDEDNVREFVRRILEASGYTVIACRNGADALLACERHPGPIDLLLTDVIMPQMSGGRLAERLSAIRPTTRVLFMSGYADDAIAQHGVLDPGTQFIAKPFTTAALATKVREVLDSGEKSPERPDGAPPPSPAAAKKRP